MKPFVPAKLPLKNLDWPDLVESLSLANRILARYDGLLQSLPNADVLLSPLTTQEAVLSSRIEGTQATLQEVLRFEAREEQSVSGDDILEIINYRKSLYAAMQELQKKPVSLNLLKSTHSMLLSNVRGKDKMLGQFRNLQNWIGKPGTPIEQARFVPPAPAVLNSSLDNFEKYIHMNEKDVLVQLALIHAQFEIIHPFLDGNGRIGRILVPLFLYQKEILVKPMFYISAYFEAHRDEYYDRLKEITDSGDWNNWVRFFLNAVIEQGRNNSSKAQEILKEYNAMKLKIVSLTRSQYSIQTIDFLFKYPIFDSALFKRNSKIPKASATRIISKLADDGIIMQLEKAQGRKGAIFIFKKLIDIVES